MTADAATRACAQAPVSPMPLPSSPPPLMAALLRAAASNGQSVKKCLTKTCKSEIR
jgi:hypothetical protein